MDGILESHRMLEHAEAHRRRTQSIVLVCICTVIGAAAQILMKIGVQTVSSPNPLALLRNTPLLAGYALYGLFTGLFVIALRNGELSTLYPIISLNYVWVSILSAYIFSETLNPYRILGLTIVVAGVAVLGRGGQPARLTAGSK